MTGKESREFRPGDMVEFTLYNSSATGIVKFKRDDTAFWCVASYFWRRNLLLYLHESQLKLANAPEQNNIIGWDSCAWKPKENRC